MVVVDVVFGSAIVAECMMHNWGGDQVIPRFKLRKHTALGGSSAMVLFLLLLLIRVWLFVDVR